ncbi:MAG: hypothetical protein WBX27_00445 [Specibacter sp.]
MPAQKKRRQPTPEPTPAESPAATLTGALLARRLMDEARTRPAVVVSHLPDAGHRRIDAAALARLVDGEADVYEVENGLQTHKLQDGLPDGLEVYGTAARVYPAGPGWVAATPEPRLARAGVNMRRLLEDVAGDVRAAVHRTIPPGPAAKPATETATGTVRGFASDDNSRALVKLALTGKVVMVRAEDLLPGVPLNWVLAPGQQVTGALDSENGTLDIHAMAVKPGSPVTVYSAGDVALARVNSTSATHAMVALWPGTCFRIGVDRISSNELDSAEDLLTEGEVVRVRVLYENGTVVLSMLDVDDDEPLVAAPALVSGGPPWLDLDRPYASIFAPPAVAGPPGETGPNAPAGAEESGTTGVALPAEEPVLTASERKTALKSTQMELERARHTITELLAAADKRGATDKIARALQDQLADERANLAELARLHNGATHQIDVLKAEAVRAKAKLVDAKQQRRSASSRTDPVAASLFIDPQEQLAFEVYTVWAHSVPAVDKAAEPLGPYLVGPNFLASLAQLTPQQRTKTLRAVVDLAAGRQGPLRNREPHMLRENEGAHAPVQKRGDDVCWRLYVEQGTAGALRLHYWKLPDGRIELSRVVTHDDVKP